MVKLHSHWHLLYLYNIILIILFYQILLAIEWDVFFFKVLRLPKKIMQDDINRIENYFPTIILFLR